MGNLNLLEPSGPVQACNGTAGPLPLFFYNVVVVVVVVIHCTISAMQISALNREQAKNIAQT